MVRFYEVTYRPPRAGSAVVAWRLTAESAAAARRAASHFGTVEAVRPLTTLDVLDRIVDLLRPYAEGET